MERKINWKLIFNVIALMIPLALIVYFCVSENGLVDLIQNAEKFNKFWLFMALACHLANVVIDMYMLYRFTNNYDKSYTFKKAAKCTCVGQFYSVITPGAVGGQPMQIYCMNKQKVDAGVSTSALLQKFLVYQTTITFYSLIAMLCNFGIFQGNFSEVMVGLAAFGFISHAAVIFFVFLFSLNKKITSKFINFFFNILAKIKIIKNPENKIEKVEKQLELFHDSNKKLYSNKKLLFSTCFFTVIQLTLIFLVPYMIYRAFDFRGASPFDMITSQSIVCMISSFMPLPGGSGAAEGSFYLFFGMFFTANTIKSAILIWRIITYFLNIVIFAPFSHVKGEKEILKNI